MQEYHLTHKTKKTILALGSESDGNFCIFKAGKIYFSESFGDLLEEKNWQNYQQAVLEFLKKYNFKPDMVLTDLHPLYLTSTWGEALSKKYKAEHVQIQHHLAHIFSAIGDSMISGGTCPVKRDSVFYGVAMDGTGYGEDGRIWGGEVFQIFNSPACHSRVGGNPVASQLIGRSDFLFRKNSGDSINVCIQRIGHLENQILIGGDLAIREPARMLISVLDKVFSAPSSPSGRGYHEHVTGEGKGELQRKNAIHCFVKKYYTKNEFELIYNQLKQDFNCLESSSTGRILDAVSLLLGFCGNERKYKHEPIALLEANSGKPYTDLTPSISLSRSGSISNLKFPISNQFQMTKFQNNPYILNTTFLFEYLVKNLHKDKKRLAATAQLYIAQGLCEIIKNSCYPERSRSLPAGRQGSAHKYHQRYSTEDSSTPLRCAQNDIFIGGGIANNKIISEFLISQGAYANKKISRGDAGLSFGQIVYYLLSN